MSTKQVLWLDDQFYSKSDPSPLHAWHRWILAQHGIKLITCCSIGEFYNHLIANQPIFDRLVIDIMLKHEKAKFLDCFLNVKVEIAPIIAGKQLLHALRNSTYDNQRSSDVPTKYLNCPIALLSTSPVHLGSAFNELDADRRTGVWMVTKDLTVDRDTAFPGHRFIHEMTEFLK
jgi:hypothetical protein